MAWEEYYTPADYLDDEDIREEINPDVIHSTDQALLIDIEGLGECWVPKSQISLTIPEWLFNKLKSKGGHR